MYDDFIRTLEEYRKLPADQQSAMSTWWIIYGMLMFFRYVITGAVVFLLGRRIINAFAFSLKPVREEDR